MATAGEAEAKRSSNQVDSMFGDTELNRVIQELSPIKVYSHKEAPKETTGRLPNKNRIKRDALWKPLLRKFR